MREKKEKKNIYSTCTQKAYTLKTDRTAKASYQKREFETRIRETVTSSLMNLKRARDRYVRISGIRNPAPTENQQQV